MQAALLAAGSLDPDVVRRLDAAPGVGPAVSRGRRPPRARCARARAARPVRSARRPRRRGTQRLAGRVARGRAGRGDDRRPAADTSERSARGSVRASRRAAGDEARGRRARASRACRPSSRADDATTTTAAATSSRAPIGGGGAVGRLLKRTARARCGSSAAAGLRAPTHRLIGRARGTRSARDRRVLDADGRGPRGRRGRRPRNDVPRVGRGSTTLPAGLVHGASRSSPSRRPHAARGVGRNHGLRRPLARLGMDLERRRRQLQGDDIDIDAAVEARVDVLAGSAPDEAIYIDSLRRRRDLAVLLLLDVSGSVGRAARRARPCTSTSAPRPPRSRSLSTSSAIASRCTPSARRGERPCSGAGEALRRRARRAS